MSATLQLNCWVFDDDVSQVFPVKITNTESVGILKEVIKDKSQEAFHNVDARSLTLWKVSIPVDRHLQQSLANLDLTNETSLSSVDDLFDVFSDVPPRKHLHIVIKPPVVPPPNLPSGPQLDHRNLELQCLLLGDDVTQIAFVEIANTKPVSALKQAIKDRKPSIRHVDADALTLWKVSIPFNDGLKENVRKVQLRDEEALSPLAELSDVFPERLSKRQRFASLEVLEGHEQFWKSLWVDRVNPIQEVCVRRDSDRVEDVDVPTTMKVLHGLPKIFSSIDVLIREEYDKALLIIQQYRATHTGVIIIGHPGVGKTRLLYYLLALRLFNRQPTIFQYRPDVIVLFDANGVSPLLPHSDVSSACEDTWALVDSNQSVPTPAPMLLRDTSPYFLIVASPPCSSRWDAVQRYRPLAAYWFMQPFTLVELIQARQLQMFERNELDIQDFFETYGPSARDCFTFCSDIDSYHSLIRTKVAKMRWDKLTTALTRGVEGLSLDDGSHKVILVAPRPEDPAFPRIRIITKAVNQFLWEKDSIERGRNHRQLYRTLRREPSTECFTGMLFEPPFHELCVKGATLTLYPMTKKSDGPVNHIFVNNPQTTPEYLILLPQTRVVFNRTNPITSLLPHHYYQPTAGNQPSYDSFIYDPALRQMTIFQVTDGKNHGLKPKGMHALRDLAQKLQVNDLKLRFVIVVPEDYQVTCLVEKGMYEDLGLEMYYLEVTENELYDD